MTAVLRAYRQAYAGLPPRVWMLAGVMLVSRCGTMFLPFMAIYLTAESGYTPRQAGGMLAVYGIGAVLGTYCGGVLCQRLSPLRVIVGGLLLGVPGFLVLPYCRSPESLVAALLYLSIVRESVRPALGTATSDFSPIEMHSKAFALNRLALNLGMSIGAGVSGLLAAASYQAMFAFNALVAIVAALLLLSVFDVKDHQPHAASEASVAARGPGPWSDSVFLVFLVLQMAAGLVFFQLIGTLPMYWEEVCGIGERGVGVLFMVNTLLIVAFEMLVADRLRGFRPLPIVGAGMGLVCLGFGGSVLESWGVLGGGLTLAIALVLVWTAGEMLSAPFTMAFVASRSAGPSRAAYMGLNAASLSTAQVAAPLIGTWLYQADPSLLWWCSLAMAVTLPVAFAVLSTADR
ncbi:MAG: MFS transporter [Planctomycetota bacterium]